MYDLPIGMVLHNHYTIDFSNRGYVPSLRNPGVFFRGLIVHRRLFRVWLLWYPWDRGRKWLVFVDCRIGFRSRIDLNRTRLRRGVQRVESVDLGE